MNNTKMMKILNGKDHIELNYFTCEELGIQDYYLKLSKCDFQLLLIKEICEPTKIFSFEVRLNGFKCRMRIEDKDSTFIKKGLCHITTNIFSRYLNENDN